LLIQSEAYIQYVEHKQLYPVLVKYQIIGYFRYVDDIFIIYNQCHFFLETALQNKSWQICGTGFKHVMILCRQLQGLL
jgi:hypothetical protein